ncbi:hypothetical protein, partial [Proteus vulgaris]|uniref:hypothetical protein n=1 Tax=Proteus vulgaris TaxID=585 RepID=UPI0023615B29
SLNAIDTIKYSIQENIFFKKILITMVIVFFSIAFLFIIARYIGKFNYSNARGENKNIKSQVQMDYANTSFINNI